MDKTMKIQKVYRALLFARNILDYDAKLKGLESAVEETQTNMDAVKITVNLAEEFRRVYPEVTDSEILDLMYKELAAALERLESNINCINENIEQIDSNIIQILEQVLPNGQGCIGISDDTFEEKFINEYTYIFNNIKVAGNPVKPEMFFSSPTMCYNPSTLPISAEPKQSAQDTASENPVQPLSSDEYENNTLDVAVQIAEDDFDEETPFEDKPSRAVASQPVGGDDPLAEVMSQDFETSYRPG